MIARIPIIRCGGPIPCGVIKVMTDGIVHHTSSCKKCFLIVLSVKTLFAFLNISNMKLPYLLPWLGAGLLAIFSCSKSSTHPLPSGQDHPSITISDVTLARQPRQNISFRFYLGLSTSSTQEITVNYHTEAGTAIAGK